MQDLQLDQKTSPTLLLAVRSLDDPESLQRFLTTYEPLMVRWLKSKGVPEFAIAEILSDVYVKLVVQLPKFVYDSSKSFQEKMASACGWAVTKQWLRLVSIP